MFKELLISDISNSLMVSLKSIAKILLGFLFAFYLSCFDCYSQIPIKLRSTTGIAGSTCNVITGGKKYIVQQSIGQASVIGLYKNQYNSVLQGFIQPSLIVISGLMDKSSTLNATVNPNPFNDNITVTFSDEMTDNLFVTLYNSQGNVVCQCQYAATQNINLNFGNITAGLYVLKINSGGKHLVSKIVKR